MHCHPNPNFFPWSRIYYSPVKSNLFPCYSPVNPLLIRCYERTSSPVRAEFIAGSLAGNVVSLLFAAPCGFRMHRGKR
jgi:hypothetical protein